MIARRQFARDSLAWVRAPVEGVAAGGADFCYFQPVNTARIKQ